MWGMVSSKEGRKHMQASITTSKLEKAIICKENEK
jgi:hypothetical protein